MSLEAFGSRQMVLGVPHQAEGRHELDDKAVFGEETRALEL